MKTRPHFVYYWGLPGEEMYAFYRDEIGSDVSAETLHERGIPIPLTPTYKTWEKLTREKKRCRMCWTTLRGSVEDYQRHYAWHLKKEVKEGGELVEVEKEPARPIEAFLYGKEGRMMGDY